MRLLFDTSVLIAAFVAAHSKHHQAFPWLQKVKSKKNSLVVSAHSLAECYSVLTRLPLSPRISPDSAFYLIRENIEKSSEIIALSSRDYQTIIKNMSEQGLSGGIIYDAITLKAAQKADVDKLLTFNQRDFIRLIPDDPGFIISP